MHYRKGFKRIIAIVLSLWFALCWTKALLLAIEADRLINGVVSTEVGKGYGLRAEALEVFGNSFSIPAFLSIGIWCIAWVIKWVIRGFKPEE